MSPHFERALKFAETSDNPGAWTLAELHRLALEFERTHELAIHAAARVAYQWGEEAAGGTGQGGEGYFNLAAIIENMKVSK